MILIEAKPWSASVALSPWWKSSLRPMLAACAAQPGLCSSWAANRTPAACSVTQYTAKPSCCGLCWKALTLLDLCVCVLFFCTARHVLLTF